MIRETVSRFPVFLPEYTLLRFLRCNDVLLPFVKRWLLDTQLLSNQAITVLMP